MVGSLRQRRRKVGELNPGRGSDPRAFEARYSTNARHLPDRHSPLIRGLYTLIGVTPLPTSASGPSIEAREPSHGRGLRLSRHRHILAIVQALHLSVLLLRHPIEVV